MNIDVGMVPTFHWVYADLWVALSGRAVRVLYVAEIHYFTTTYGDGTSPTSVLRFIYPTNLCRAVSFSSRLDLPDFLGVLIFVRRKDAHDLGDRSGLAPGKEQRLGEFFRRHFVDGGL